MDGFGKGRRALACLAITGLLAIWPEGSGFGSGRAAAQSPGSGRRSEALSALVVTADRGGALAPRGSQVRALQAAGRRVELRGICLSACTLYLALPMACVAPGARFGFHGPNWQGRALTAPEFERWSQFMAGHYREPLRGWFLREARHELRGYRLLSGAELIRMGYARC